MPTNIDQLQIEVTTKSNDAVTGLKGLKKALQSIEQISKSSGLDDLVTKLDKISKVNFNNLKKLNALGNTLKQVNRLTKDVADLSSKMSSMPTNVDIDADGTSMDNINAKADAFNDTMKGTRTATQSATKGLKSLKGGLDGASASFKKTTKKASELSKVLKIVLVYGGAFRAVSMMTQGVSEGLKNVAQYNNETAAAMSRLSTMSLYLKNAMGAVLYPAIVALTPALQTLTNGLVKAMEVLSQFIAILSGKSTYLKAKEYMKSYVDDAKKTANEVKKSFAGMDEITVIGDKGGGSSGGGNTDNPADMFEEVAISDSMKESLDKVLEVVTLIGAAIGAWALSKSLISGIEWLKTIQPSNFIWSFSLLGATMFIADLDKLRGYLEDIQENGLDFTNVSGALSEFAGLMGDALLLLGNLKFAGALKTVQGIGEIVSAVSDISTNGADVENVSTVIRGLTNIAIGISLFTGNIKVAGAAAAIQGLNSVISEIATNWEAIKNGDWSGVDKATIIIGVVEFFGGLVTALGVFSKAKGKVDIPKATSDMEEVANATDSVNKTTSKLTSKLTSLVKNLALGLVIIAEVAVAAGLIVGAIWGLGAMLEQVGLAWQPVIDNGETVAIAVGIGTAILVGIGVVTAVLGTAGTALITQLALGIAMMALLGVSAGLFLAEILIVGVALDAIGQAWAPVLNNGENIATAIGLGTVLLIGIGVVAAALGVATVASAGLLPLAIGLGTALLVELAIAFVLFCDSLIDVANKLIELSVPLGELNAILPGLKTDMDSYTAFMGDFAKAVVAFTAVNAIASIAATIDKVIDFFTTDPVSRMNDEVSDQIGEFENLITALEKINPLIARATELVGVYKSNMGSFESATGGSGGFLNTIVNGAKGVINGLIAMFEGLANGAIKGVNAIIRGLNNVSFDVPDWVPGIGGRTLGFNISTIGTISIPRFATGGFPEDGLFMANHGELVGQFSNGKTAVANNEQIVAGITGGVYAANQEQNSLLREQNKLLRQLVENGSNGQIDVTTITSAMQRKNRRDGKTVVPVGV